MGSIPSILVIVNHCFFFKSTKKPLYARQFGKRTTAKRTKSVRPKADLQVKTKVKLTRPVRQSTNLLHPLLTRKWSMLQYKKRRTTKGTFLANQSLRHQPKFY